jgi:hypothetical protein
VAEPAEQDEPDDVVESVEASDSEEKVESEEVAVSAETAETTLNEPSDESSDEHTVSPTITKPAPVVLGKLPPPPTDAVVAMPSADDQDSSSLWKQEDDDLPEEPDTEDEPTEVASMAKRMETDEQADQWDRMLALDKKSVASVDKEWSRAARGEPEGRRFVLMAVVGVGVGLLVAWYAGLLNFNNGLMSEQTEVQPVDETQVDVPVVPTVESLPEAAPEQKPEVVEALPVEDERPPAAVPVEPVPTLDELPSAPPVEAKPPPKATPAPTKSKPPPPPPPPPPPEEVVEEPVPEETPAVAEPPPALSTAAVRITGDASMVHLVSGTRRLNGGRIPPGEYQIEVVFKQNDMPQNQGSLRLEAGQSAIVNCKASFYRCTVRGPW